MPLQYELLDEEDAQGNVFPSYHATCYCTEEGTDSFHLFQPAHVNHLHLQCTSCEESYCTAGTCVSNIQPATAQ